MLYFKEGQIPLWFEFLYYILYVIIFFFIIRRCNRDSFYNKFNNGQGLFFCLIFTICACFYFMGGDYYSYLRYVQKASSKINESGIEVFYQKLAYWCQGNNDLFRIIIWGSAIFLVWISAIKVKSNSLLTLSILFLLFYDIFCYARASLAMATYFFGICLMVSSDKLSLQKLLGLIIMASSVYLHRSMLIIVIITPFALLLPLKKSYFFSFILIAVLFIAIGMNFFSSQLIDNAGEDSLNYSQKIEHYGEALSNNVWALTSIKSIVNYTIKYALFYLTLFRMMSSSLMLTGAVASFTYVSILSMRFSNCCQRPLSMVMTSILVSFLV